MSVCFASYEGFEGCVQSCRNAAAVLGGNWAIISPASEPPPEVWNADLLVLSSWHERYEPIVAARAEPVVARWHSPLLQTDLAKEGCKIARIVDLLDRNVLAGIAVDDREFVRVLDRDAVVWFPVVLDDSEYLGVAALQLRGVHVSLFGGSEGRKNILVQSAAFARARRAVGDATWTLHLNGQSFADPNYDRWLEAARIPYVDHGWLKRTDYLSLVAGMSAGLCATLSESYCYVAADHVALGVPIVASPAIACLGADSPGVRADDIDAIAAALVTALAPDSFVAAAQRQSLIAQARRNADAARGALHRISALARGGPM